MGTIRVTGLSKAFGTEELFNDVSFEIKRGEKVGFVGANGAGKSTLMKCLLNKEEYDRGNISIDSADTIGYVEQQADMDSDGTLYEELKSVFSDVMKLKAAKETMEAELAENADADKLKQYGRLVERFEHLDGYDYASSIRRTAFGLGFTEEDLAKQVAHFSGGQRTRVCLAKALLREPDFLFLDEPTNHLDISMIEWLEGFLQTYTGGVLIISHDRFFLDRVTNRIFEIDNKTVTVYEGNYSYFMKVREQRRAAQLTAYEKQQEYIKKTEDYIRKYKAGIKSKQARGRQSQLNRLERIVKPAETAAFNYFAFNAPSDCAQRVAELEDISYKFPDRTLFEHVNVLIRKGDGIAVVGPNGAGKTTLLRLLVGELESPTGRLKIGSRVKIGYFSQQHEGLHMDRSLLDEMLYEYGLDEQQARRYLGAFLFHGDDVFRLIGDLSGGEQSRLAFLKLMLTGANFLVLDEPTNHLDIPAKEAVEEALSTFPGTYITVSHDRYFLDKVANCVLELSEGTLHEYIGNYSYYREKKAEENEARITDAKEHSDAAKKKDNKPEGAAIHEGAGAGRADQAKRGAILSMSDDKRNQLIHRAEAQIATIEMDLKCLELTMNSPEVQADPGKSIEIANEYEAKTKELDEWYDKWAQLTEA
ncbi:MAG: ABC-F family ATP-binding cassette domain-containing protein [Anaerovibrio sp.]|uniref:ABC-F family ATP-binding cassette domain-containing protein n=1 Tax=Anaerovibrio sp. TaxID=1872532 RepID=UPI0025F80D08|nr:ABC-F family ATP-binding cassette domain-containing protein [Anaerovibrio sp.]MCR5176491.1 ABC-F family ATP-binding cassette domain-containing protein [Anaerovibrio sp.]